MSERHEVESRAVRVTLFEDRAEVIRVARVSLPAGTHALALGGVTPVVDDASLAVEVEGGVLLGARVGRRKRELVGATHEELAALEEAQKRAASERAEAERAIARAAARRARVEALLGAFGAELAASSRGLGGVVAGLAEAHDALDGELLAALDEAEAAEAALDAANLEAERTALRLGLARAVTPRFEAALEVEVALPEPAEVALEARYRTPCALWRPEHVAALSPGGEARLEVQTFATAWQHTGEVWEGVQARFSTARPARAASPPELEDEVLALQKRLEREIAVEARDEEVHTLGPEEGARKVDEMPGVDDGGEPRVFEAHGAVTIPSGGAPVRVQVADRTLDCDVVLRALPERAPSVHHVARASWAGAMPLLAGPVRLLRRGEAIGRGRVGFVAPGEAFELGFGADDGLRIRRAVADSRETTAIVGTQKLERTVTLTLSNLSGSPRSLEVVERVPRSELEDLTVRVDKAAGGTLDEVTGFLRIPVELAAGATWKAEIVVRIEASARIRMPF